MNQSTSHHINRINDPDSDGSNPSSNFIKTPSKVIEKIHHRKFNGTVCIAMRYSLPKDSEHTSWEMTLIDAEIM